MTHYSPFRQTLLGITLGTLVMACGSTGAPAGTDESREQGSEPPAAVATDSAPEADTGAAARPEEQPSAPEPENYGNFTREQLTELILGELGGQRGRLEDAADRYYRLAMNTGDLGIMRRAAEYNAAAGELTRTLRLTDRWIELAPDEQEAYLMRSFHRLRRGQFLPAMEDLATVLELGGEADFTAVSARSPDLDPPSRQRVLERLAGLRDQYPEEPSLYYSLAQMLDQANQRDEARQVLEEAAERFGETARQLIIEAQLLQNEGRQEEALAALQRGINRYPDHRLLRYNYAQLLLQSGDLRLARNQFDRLVRQRPGDMESLYSLAVLNMELGADREAGAQLEILVNAGYRRNEALYHLASLAERNGAAEQALQWYSGVERGSGAFLPAQRQALRLLVRRGEYEQARNWSEETIARHPDMAALMRTLEAEALLGAGLRNRAGELLDQALRQFPDNVDLLFTRTLLNEQLGDHAAVERDLRHIIRLDPDNARALNHLGYSLTIHTDRYEEALDLIEKAIALEPDDPAIIDSLGWVQYKLGQLDDALHNLERAYEMFPNHEVAAHLGEVLWARGERDRAMSVWEEALEEEPDSEYINEAMDRLVR